MNLNDILLWLHVLCMVGALGGLFFHRCLALETNASPALRLFNILILVGLVTGLSYYIRQGYTAPEIHMTIAAKFVLLFVAGGASGMGSALAKKGRTAAAGKLYWLAILAMAAAAFLGLSIRGLLHAA